MGRAYRPPRAFHSRHWLLAKATMTEPKPSRRFFPSFPLDRPRRLARHVVDDPIDALDLVVNPRRGAAKKCHVERKKIRGHAIGRGDRTQRADEIITPPIAHDADAAHRQQHRERLPNLVVKASLADFVEIDSIRPTQNIKLFRGDLAKAADREPRPGKRMPVDKTSGQAQFAA